MLFRTLFVCGGLLTSVFLLEQDGCCEDGQDLDGDGYCANKTDCDDNDEHVNPDHPEWCDGKDNNCDGIMLPGGEDDADGDGVRVCAGDCDDANVDIYTGAAEQCDGLDNDCDGVIPSDEADKDGDGHWGCDGDCDDSDPFTYIGAEERCDGVDNNCDGRVEAGGEDLDGDGFGLCADDCDDGDPLVYLGADELCDGVDQDCDGLADISNGTGEAWERLVCGAVVGTTSGGIDSLGDDQPSMLYNRSFGKYQMWFRMIVGGSNRHSIGYAESENGVVWSKYDTPVFEPGSDGTWDSLRLGYPSVLLKDGIYHMWYHGNETDNKIRIGHVYSQDGLAWTRSPENPVLDVGGQGAWDQTLVHAPSVIYDADDRLFKMWYGGSDGTNVRIGYAESADGLAWTKHQTWVLNVGFSGEWDDKRVVFPRVHKIDGAYHMWFSGDDIFNAFSYEVGYATSLDGINWTTSPDNPVFSFDVSGDSGSFDSFMVYAADVVSLWDGYGLFYAGGDSLSGPFSIGIAFSHSF